MRTRRVAVYTVSVTSFLLSLALVLFACSSTNNTSGFGPSSSSGSGGSGSGSGSSGGSGSGSGGAGSGSGGFGGSGSSSGGTQDAGVQYTDGGCQGLQCQITACSNDGGTTITGRVMDPAGANPLYNALAYVPMYDPANPSAIPSGAEIQPITGGVSFPAGVTCDSCSYLYTGNPIAVGSSDTDGNFTITNAPSGSNIPVVIQVGKWRTHTTVSTVPSCGTANAGAINLPGETTSSDPIISMPQIAISMGGADSIECLLYRMGISLNEIVSGASSTGHIHIFSGDGGGIFGGGTSVPLSSASMWDTLADLEKYDVSLFACEGSEPSSANPALLEQYVNAGGRAFLSHYHYAWLAGPLLGGGTYKANADWGGNILASWNPMDPGATGNPAVEASINTTLNVGGGTFQKGADLLSWLGNVKALGTGANASDVEVQGPAYDPLVSSTNVHSQAWATYTTTLSGNDYPTAYFSFDTPINAVENDAGVAPYCGRVVFSGLHVGAADNDQDDTMPSSSTCNPGPGQLSPQEKVLEFMLFDLSSCVTPDKAAPGSPIPPPPPPNPPK